MRYSKQREEILKIVLNSYDHPTVEDIHNRVKKIIPNISLGTVYRNLTALSENNSIKVIKGIDKKDRYDKTLYDHGHIYCIECNEVEDIINKEFNAIRNKLEEKNFSILNYNITINGLCHKCHSKGKRK